MASVDVGGFLALLYGHTRVLVGGCLKVTFGDLVKDNVYAGTRLCWLHRQAELCIRCIGKPSRMLVGLASRVICWHDCQARV